MKNLPKIGLPIIIILGLLLLLGGKTFVTINAGQAGVVFKTFDGGVVTDQPALGEGLQFIWPWNSVVIYPVRQQNEDVKMGGLSSNGLEIKLEVTAWYQPTLEQLGMLHQEKGVNYKNSILLPAIRSAARSVVGRYTPEEIYSTKRDAIQTEIFYETKKNCC